jgi:hypothetical protein
VNVLIAGEESQAVCLAFRRRGHEAFSCDLQPCSGGHPEYHIMGDYVDAIKSRIWDFIGFHPDCTKMAVSGNRWYGAGTSRHHERIEAVEETIKTWRLIKKHSKRGYCENPVSVLFSHHEMVNVQYIQPWQFGHGETKKTGLELYNLEPLKPTNIVSGRENRIWKMSPSVDRKKLRSKTFPGIAAAMADQWGGLK